MGSEEVECEIEACFSKLFFQLWLVEEVDTELLGLSDQRIDKSSTSDHDDELMI